jgi:formiminotetrahydrofolate cyclodeaminase
MVARLTLGRKKYEEVQPQMQSVLEQAEALRIQLAAAVDQDAVAFEQVMAAFRLPKDTEDQAAVRDVAIQQATIRAAEVPLETARASVRVMELALQAAQLGNHNAISDAASGATLAQASLTSAGYNVRINTLDLTNGDAELLLVPLSGLEERAAKIKAALEQTLSEQAGLTLA